MQDAARRLSWNANVPYSTSFQTTNRAKINTEDLFTQFLKESADPKAYKFNICINKVNPKTVAQKEAAKEKLEATQGNKKIQAGADADDWEPLAGASHLSNMFDTIAMIKSKHPPKGHLTGFHEVSLYVNPKNSKELMILDLNRVTVWAKAIMKKGLVNLYHPPNVPGFDWDNSAPAQLSAATATVAPEPTPIPTAGLPSTPAAMPIQNKDQLHVAWDPLLGKMMAYKFHHAANQTGPAMVHPVGKVQMTHQDGPAGNQQRAGPPNDLSQAIPRPHGGGPPNPPAPQPPSSPAPFNDDASLNEYLRFVHVDPSCPKIRENLDGLGINHYSKLSLMKPKELEKGGLKVADAQALISNLKRYEHHLKKQRGCSE
ncbi:hypothetical protein PtB15_9B425 [Puccinia triticina]|nr:hypothetical protein PtB15_9B425 [Puccinia triticina]